MNGRPTGWRVRLASRWIERQVGLLNHLELGPDTGVWLRPSGRIHTLGMQFAIDVLFLDRHGVVLDIASRVPPGKRSLAGPRGSVQVVEIASGVVGSTLSVRVGDRVALHLGPQPAQDACGQVG